MHFDGVQVRNARLAMLANLGFWSQAAVTGKGPIQNLTDHLADPLHNNSAQPSSLHRNTKQRSWHAPCTTWNANNC